MTNERFTNIEHDYENAWIKCNDNGYFMIYPIYKELDESLPSLGDLLNGLSKENEQLKQENEQLKEKIARQKFSKRMMKNNIKDYERAIKSLRKGYKEFDEMRLDRIRFLEKRLKKNGLSIYVNECGELE